MAENTHWDSDEEHPIEDWMADVAAGDTRLGYRDWVRHNSDQPIDINAVIRTLNEACAADPMAMKYLMTHRTMCSQALADHPTIVCEEAGAPESPVYAVGALGLINGILQPLIGLSVAARYDEITEELVGFQVYGG